MYIHIKIVNTYACKTATNNSKPIKTVNNAKGTRAGKIEILSNIIQIKFIIIFNNV